jgi:hypothetical protein
VPAKADTSSSLACIFHLAKYHTMGAGAFIEPLVVITLLFGGTWVNRNTEYRLFGRPRVYQNSPRSTSPDSGRSSPLSSASLLANVDEEPRWQKRDIAILGMRKQVLSPNTKRFQHYFLSRLLRKYPFLVEAWYWALIYWVSQPGMPWTYEHADCDARFTRSAAASLPYF